MENGLPLLTDYDQKEKLSEPHPIWVTKSMFDQIQILKAQRGNSTVNDWLRDLWKYGLDKQQSKVQNEQAG